MVGVAQITIAQETGGIAIDCRGSFPPGEDTLLERLALAAVAGIEAEMKKLQDAGEFSEPFVSGNEESIKRSPYADAKRRRPDPPHHEGPTYWG